MKRRRFCWFLLVPVGLILTPVLIWSLIILIAPTGWARSHVITALEKSSGRSVKLERLGVCLLGGIELTNLEIGSPQTVADPWLKAAKIRIDVSLLQLLRGKLEPTSVEAEGATLRVLRREDGTLELSDLVGAGTTPDDSTQADAKSHGPRRLLARIRQARILMIDEPTRTRLELSQVDGDGIWEEKGTASVTLSGSLNQGPFELTAELDRSSMEPSFQGQFRAKDVVLNQGMSVLRYLVPVLAGTPGDIDGRMTMDVYLTGKGLDRESLYKSLAGQGNVSLDPIELDGSPLVAEIAKVVELPRRGTVGAIRSDFAIRDSRVSSDRLTLTVGRIPLVMSGWTGFDGQLNYQLKLEGMTDRVPQKARRFLSELDLDLESMTTVRVRGTVDQLAVQINGLSVDGRPLGDQGLQRDDRERLKVLGRRLRDKILR